VWDAAYINNDNFFSSRNLGLSLFCDGIPIFKSSKTTMWPVYYSILNLPPSVRTKASNILLGGLWIGPGKPPFEHLLKPLIKELNDLSTVGITITLATGNVTIKAKLVLGIFDLPAKAAILSTTLFNGEFGCQVCLHPGEQLSHRRVYPPRITTIRTHDLMISLGEDAAKCGKPKKGVKGISPLADCLNLVDSVPVDYMHAVIEGVMGRLMTLWFESKYHKQQYYLRKSLNHIDALLMSQTPPDDFTRSPRSISRHRKYWKASELKQWLLFYSLPILQNKLPCVYWHHYSLLVTALHILLKDKIKFTELNAVEIMMKDFVNMFQELYGTIHCTHNLHLLSHIIMYVRLWGPLWTHSAFPFENKNGLMKNLFHGKNDISQQIVFNANAQSTVQSLTYDIKLSDGDKVANFINNDRNFKSNMLQIAEHLYAVGNTAHATLTRDQQDVLQSHGSHEVQVFYRLFKDGIMYHCTNYASHNYRKRNNTFCTFLTTSGAIHYGQLVLFVLHPRPCALVKELQSTHASLSRQAGFTDHPLLIKHQKIDILNSLMPAVSVSGGRLTCINLQQIHKKAVLIKVESQEYICSIPNSYEHH